MSEEEEACQSSGTKSGERRPGGSESQFVRMVRMSPRRPTENERTTRREERGGERTETGPESLYRGNL